MKNPLEVPHLRSLEADIAQLGQAFNHNTKIHNHALTVAEMRLCVLERALHDQVRGCLRVTTIDGQQSVDFGSYVSEFGMCMLMSEFAMWLRRIGHLDEEKAGPGPILTPSEEDVLVFGGG